MRYPGIPHPGGERSAMKRIDILPSKSAAHRMLIAAALCEEPCDVILSERSLDIEATENCLAEIRRVRKEGATPEGNGEAVEEAQLHCGESGSTFRFLIPLVAALGMDAKFYPEGRLSQRPLSPLVEELEKKGVTFSPLGANPFHVKGQLEPGAFRIPGNVSSQYITGLLMALPLLADDSTIRVTGERQSVGYVNLTLQVLREFGIEIITERMGEELVYRIPGNQKYRSPGTCKVEGDWSNAAFWLTAGVLGEEAVQVTGPESEFGPGRPKNSGTAPPIWRKNRSSRGYGYRLSLRTVSAGDCHRCVPDSGHGAGTGIGGIGSKWDNGNPPCGAASSEGKRPADVCYGSTERFRWPGGRAAGRIGDYRKGRSFWRKSGWI